MSHNSHDYHKYCIRFLSTPKSNNVCKQEAQIQEIQICNYRRDNLHSINIVQWWQIDVVVDMTASITFIFRAALEREG